MLNRNKKNTEVAQVVAPEPEPEPPPTVDGLLTELHEAERALLAEHIKAIADAPGTGVLSSAEGLGSAIEDIRTKGLQPQKVYAAHAQVLRLTVEVDKVDLSTEAAREQELKAATKEADLERHAAMLRAKALNDQYMSARRERSELERKVEHDEGLLRVLLDAAVSREYGRIPGGVSRTAGYDQNLEPSIWGPVSPGITPTEEMELFGKQISAVLLALDDSTTPRQWKQGSEWGARREQARQKLRDLRVLVNDKLALARGSSSTVGNYGAEMLVQPVRGRVPVPLEELVARERSDRASGRSPRSWFALPTNEPIIVRPSDTEHKGPRVPTPPIIAASIEDAVVMVRHELLAILEELRG